MGVTFSKNYDINYGTSDQFNYNYTRVIDKQILYELIKDINRYINIKWTGIPMTVQEIEKVFDLHL
jgi:hypothetical protein